MVWLYSGYADSSKSAADNVTLEGDHQRTDSSTDPTVRRFMHGFHRSLMCETNVRFGAKFAGRVTIGLDRS
jgi:hypothetical protein